MRDLDAVITQDGTVYHLAWANHLQTIAHFKIPENVSEWRQNYYEYDIHAPFTDNLGLQARGIQDPPEAVVRSAERLTEQLRNWHRGLDFRSIPEDWGDVVEHVYETRGAKTPKYLNGRGGVYFCGELEEVREGCIHRLLGSARIRRLAGHACVSQVWGNARIDEMADRAQVESTWQAARIGKMSGWSQIGMMCQSSSVGEMRDDARILILHGATRVEALFGRALCARGADGFVFTPDGTVGRDVLATHEKWQDLRFVAEGEAVHA